MGRCKHEITNYMPCNKNHLHLTAQSVKEFLLNFLHVLTVDSFGDVRVADGDFAAETERKG